MSSFGGIVMVAVEPDHVHPMFSSYQAWSLTIKSGFSVKVKAVFIPFTVPVAASLVKPPPPETTDAEILTFLLTSSLEYVHERDELF